MSGRPVPAAHAAQVDASSAPQSATMRFHEWASPMPDGRRVNVRPESQWSKPGNLRVVAHHPEVKLPRRLVPCGIEFGPREHYAVFA